MQFATQFATPQIWLGRRTEAEKFAISDLLSFAALPVIGYIYPITKPDKPILSQILPTVCPALRSSIWHAIFRDA
jgi:hypothetical protein